MGEPGATWLLLQCPLLPSLLPSHPSLAHFYFFMLPPVLIGARRWEGTSTRKLSTRPLLLGPPLKKEHPPDPHTAFTYYHWAAQEPVQLYLPVPGRLSQLWSRAGTEEPNVSGATILHAWEILPGSGRQVPRRSGSSRAGEGWVQLFFFFFSGSPGKCRQVGKLREEVPAYLILCPSECGMGWRKQGGAATPPPPTPSLLPGTTTAVTPSKSQDLSELQLETRDLNKEDLFS